MTSTNKGENDAELTPEAKMILSKARRSFGFSITILLVGFIAIAFALVYRATRDSGGPAEHIALDAITIPAGAEIIALSANKDMIAVTFSANGATTLRLLDAKTGAMLRDIPVKTE